MRPGGKDSVLAYDDLEDGLNGFGREVASIAANDILYVRDLGSMALKMAWMKFSVVLRRSLDQREVFETRIWSYLLSKTSKSGVSVEDITM